MLSFLTIDWVGCGLWVVGCGLWVVGCGLWVVGCGLWVVGCGLWVNGKQLINGIGSFKINVKSSQRAGFVNIGKMFIFAAVL